MLGCLLAALFLIQTPWKPALGLLGMLMLAIVILATNAWSLRGRLPLLRSENPRVAAGGWAVIGGLVLSVGLLASGVPSGRPHASLLPSSPVQTAAPSQLAITPSPPPLPVAAPRSTPRPTPTAVSFLNAPLSVQRNQMVTLRVRTAPNTDCSINIGYPDAPELDPSTSDSAGNVSLTWRVGKHVQRGSWPITVSCGVGTARTEITVS